MRENQFNVNTWELAAELREYYSARSTWQPAAQIANKISEKAISG